MSKGTSSPRHPPGPASGPTVLTVCLNPAWDITYQVPALRPGASHTVTVIAERSGGKGTNVARTLHQLHRPVHLVGLLGGAQGDLLHEQLLQAGISCSFTPIKEPTRRSITVVDRNEATVFNETGPCVTEREWDAFVGLFADRLTGTRAVAISGSLPPGLPADAYAQLTRLANEVGVPVVLDAAGQPLALAMGGHPAIAAPNRAEVAETFGWELPDRASVVRAGHRLREMGANATVISSGAEGLFAQCDGRTWTAKPPWMVDGNPTGAGDALTAALVDGLATGGDWPQVLRSCIAWSAAAVATPWAGELNEQVLHQVLDATDVEEI